MPAGRETADLADYGFAGLSRVRRRILEGIAKPLEPKQIAVRIHGLAHAVAEEVESYVTVIMS